MKRKQSELIIAIAVLMAIVLVACNGSGTTSSASSAGTTASASSSAAESASAPAGEREFYQIEVFNVYSNYMGIQSGWWGEIVKEKFNLEINMISPNVAGTGEQLYQTRTAAGNLGDAIILDKPRIVDLQSAGLVMELSPLIANAPNIQKLHKAYEAFAQMFPDGGIYGLPGRVSVQPVTLPAGRGISPEVAPYLRYDWYLDIGAPKIVGWDGFIDVIGQMIAAHPTNENGEKNYGWSLFPDWDGDSVRAAREMLYMEGLTQGNGYVWIDTANNKLTDLMEPEGLYYQHLKILNKAYNMGLMDPDSATQTWDNVATKVRTEHRVAFAWWPFLADSVFATIDLSSRSPFAPVPVEGMVINSNSYNPYGMENNAYAIGSGAKYPERIMELFDWIASPEGVMLMNSHVEGVTYEMVDGEPVQTEFGRDANLDKQAPASMGGGSWDEGIQRFNFPLVHPDDPNELLNGFSANSSIWPSTMKRNENEFNLKWAETYGTNNPMEFFMDNGYMVVTPGIDFTSPTTPSEINTYRTQIREIFTPAGWQMIYAANEAEFQSIWDDMLKKLPDFGLEEVLEWDRELSQTKLDLINEELGR